MTYVLFLSYSLKKKRGFEKLSDLPKGTQLGSCKVIPRSTQLPWYLPLCNTAKFQNAYFLFQSQNFQSFRIGDASYTLEETFLI